MGYNYFECCMGCKPPKRYPGCSGQCPDYKEARAKFDADKNKVNATRSVRHYISEQCVKNIDGVAKYQKRRPKNFHYN